MAGKKLTLEEWRRFRKMSYRKLALAIGAAGPGHAHDLCMRKIEPVVSLTLRIQKASQYRVSLENLTAR